MKTAPKWFVLLSIVCVCILASFCLNSCQSAKEEKVPEKDGEEKLLQAGLDLAARLKEWTISYGYSGNMQEMYEIAEKQDLSAVKAVYEINLNSMVLLEQLLSGSGDLESAIQLSDSVKNRMTARAYTAFATMVNGDRGMDALVFAATYSEHKCFLYRTLEKCRIYVYVFESGYPICVTFVPEDADIVTATGHWLLMDCESINSEKDLKEELSEEEVSVKKLQ